MAEVICIGMAVADVVIKGVDLNKSPGDFDGVVPVKSVSIAGGGDALNEAIVLGYLGHDVKLMIGRADDGAGAVIARLTQKANVDMSLSGFPPGYTTPVSAMMIDDAANRVPFRPPINAEGSPMPRVSYVPDIDAIKDVKIVSLASLFMAPLNDPAPSACIVQKAKAEGAIVCADVKPYSSNKTLEDFRDTLCCLDYFFPNEQEAEHFAPHCKDHAERAAYFRSFGIQNVVIKLGDKGVLFFGENEQFQVPAFNLQAVDTTGCGDNFAAGFISGLLQGMDAKGCCEFATAAASICAETVGASIGVRSRQQVLDRMDHLRAQSLR